MKQFDYISDVHIDFWLGDTDIKSNKFQRKLDFFMNSVLCLDPDKSNTIIIAGDIGHYFKQNTAFLLRLKDYYKNIVITYGNHDMYLVSLKQQEQYNYSSYSRLSELKQFCIDNDIHFLDGDTVELDGIKIGGTGMSWDYSYAEQFDGYDKENTKKLFRDVMNDSRLIMQSKPLYTHLPYGRKLRDNFWDQEEFFKEQYQKLSLISDVDVMVTHYGPIIPDGMPDMYRNETSTFYYFNGISDIQRINPKVWIFGHTHDYYDFDVGTTRMLCNPLGYPNENKYGTVNTIVLED